MACPQTQKYSACFEPSEEKDYGRTWGDRLADDELITVSTWEITSEDEAVPTLEESAQGTGISVDQKDTSIFLIGGTNGLDYTLTNHIETIDNAGDTRKYRADGIITVVE